MNQETKARNMKIIQEMTIMDDIFMAVFFENRPEFAEEVLAAILPFKPTVESVHTHYHYTSANGHEVIFDIFAKDENNKTFNIEIQKRSDGATPKRARFYSSMLDTISLKRGEQSEDIDDTYVIFITKYDIFKDNKPIYRIERHINSKKRFNDGSHIIYLNTSYSGKSTKAIKNLIHDLKCSKPDEIINKNIAERFHQIKSGSAKEEVDSMCELLDTVMDKERAKWLKEGRAEGIAEGRAEGIAKGIAENSREIAKNMLLSGKLTVELIAEFCNLTVEEVNALKPLA